MSKKLFITAFILLGVGLMINVQSLAAVVITPPIPNFKCGTGLIPYKVLTRNLYHEVIGNGMRCVKLTLERVGKVSIAFYGEGYERSCSHRTVGELKYSKNTLYDNQTVHYGAQADIWGNGECRKAYTTLSMFATPFYNQIKVYGYTNYNYEEWTKVIQMSWTPFPRIKTCGNTNGFDQKKAVDGKTGPNRLGFGIRCVFKFYGGEKTWFGNGYWGDVTNSYTELGTIHPLFGFGSSQIIGGGSQGYGTWPLNRAYGSFNLTFNQGYGTASLPKDEYWVPN